jgi:glutamine cyclotransferase
MFVRFSLILPIFFSLLSLLCFCSAIYGIEELIPVILTRIPHNTDSFTQGLAIQEGNLYESVGLYGKSSLQQINLENGKILQQTKLPSSLFAEGIAALPHQIIQLTWRERKARLYERSSLRLVGEHVYQGEGWGLCRDKDTVWMSNGTSMIVQRDSTSFAIIQTLTITWDGQPVNYINDLECVNDELYMNIWGKDYILRVKKEIGVVTGVIYAAHLLSTKEKSKLDSLDDVLNGIAFHPDKNSFFLTGKRWPWIFEVQLTSLNR